MRWGWIGLAVFTAAFYLVQTGIIQVVYEEDTEVVEGDR